MSDQGIWFKLWDGWENDGDMAELSKEDMLHWVLLGGYLKKHGNNGTVSFSKPATALQKKLMLHGFDDVMKVLKRMPNCSIDERPNSDVTESVTSITIRWKNWLKYQGDSSKFRVQKWRVTNKVTDVTPKKRREEKREEEMRRENITPLFDFDLVWNQYPKKRGLKNAQRHFRTSVKSEADFANIQRALANYRKEIVGKDLQYIKNGDTWFNNWKDYLEEIHAPNGRTGISHYDAVARRNREAESLRKVDGGGFGSLFAGVRTSSVPEKATDKPNGQ